MQTANEMITDKRSLLTSKVQPVKNSIRLTMLDPTDCPQAVTLNEHRHCIEEQMSVCPQCLKESPCVSTEGMITSDAVVTTFSMAIDSDVVGIGLSEIRARDLIAPP
jgi:hypothetical protein